MAYGWTYLKSGLGLREDEFSWQGSVESDPRFFLRRSKDEPEKVTDLLFGDLSDDAVEPLLVEFLRLSGGVVGRQLTFTNIGRQDDNHDATVAKFDRVARVGKRAVELSGQLIVNSRLEQDGKHWNAVLKLG
ncbi:hypothetical protein NBRC116586_08170 [Pseudooceanicola nitratireducens]|uniref:hypothetical protein n=1 Tax=Pseudooceanicola nitratireducens TaxID=517719 RepID=UPI00310B15E2